MWLSATGRPADISPQNHDPKNHIYDIKVRGTQLSC